MSSLRHVACDVVTGCNIYLSFSIYIFPLFYHIVTATFTHEHIWTHTQTHTCTISTHKENWQEQGTGAWSEEGLKGLRASEI